jgi:creatinine amidohydrolase
MPVNPQPRAHVLMEANYRQLLDRRPNVAVLPWGATEAHNYHLPHGTDVIEATAVAERAADLAAGRGARVIVLPAVPFGNNAQQQDQVATIHLSATASLAVLRDVMLSLKRQGIDRLVLLNGHGGNDFKSMVRDLTLEGGVTIIVVDFWRIRPDAMDRIFSVEGPGDHGGEMETSLMLHLRPELVVMSQAGDGATKPWPLAPLLQKGAWSPRPWSIVHPDTGCGNPSSGTAAKGAEYFAAITAGIADLLVDFSSMER